MWKWVFGAKSNMRGFFVLVVFCVFSEGGEDGTEGRNGSRGTGKSGVNLLPAWRDI